MRTAGLFSKLTLGVLGSVMAVAAGLSPAVAQTVVVPVSGTLPVLTPVTINSAPGDQFDPHVSGDWVSYTSDIGIRYYNFATAADAPIPMGSSANDLLSDISGSRIVFSRVVIGSGTAIMVFDAATAAAPVVIDPLSGSTRFGAAIGGNTVAYIDFGLEPNGELVIHDLVSGTSQRITNDTAGDGNPSVSPDGNVVTWEHCATSLTNCDIHQAVKSGASWIVSVVSATASPEGNPDTNGNLVVYDSTRPAASDIFWRPVGGGPEVQLQLPSYDANPSIAGHTIAFEGRATIFDTADLFVYDIAANKLYQLTNTPLVNEQLNDITVLPDGRTRVVWATDEDAADQRNVRGATFTLPSVACAPPTIALSVSPSVLWPPNNRLVNVHATVTASSACDPNPTVVLTSITRNCIERHEDEEDRAKPDIVGAALGTLDLDFQLRAEKCEEEREADEAACERACNLTTSRKAREACRERCEHPDRIYTIVYTALDRNGTSASASATVTVPHDKQGHGEVGHGHGDGPVSLETPGVVVTIRTLAPIASAPEGDPGDPVDLALAGPRPAPAFLFDARTVDPSQIILGNSSILVAPTETRLADVDGDGYDDLVLRYTGPEYRALMAAPIAVDDSITLYYRSADGTGYEVQHLIAAGAPVDIAPLEGTAQQSPAAGNDLKPSTTELTGVYPNPVRTEASVVFTLAHDERVDLAVYDLRGARVRTLERGLRAAGRYQVSWNGRADDGHRLAGGMYFVRFAAGRFARTVKTAIMP